MMWVNHILQGKTEEQLDIDMISDAESRGPRKHEVVFTTDVESLTLDWLQMVIREDRDLNISINQYKIIKEISAGINSRVEACKSL